jgi:hypothetical protein
MRKPTDWVVVRLFAAIPAGLSMIVAGVCAVFTGVFWDDLMNGVGNAVTAFVLINILVYFYRRRRRKRKVYNPKWAKLTGEQWLNILAAIPTCIVIFAACMCLVMELITYIAM